MLISGWRTQLAASVCVWETLTGSDDTTENTHLMRMAGRFSRRLHGYAKAEGIPLVHCQAGKRKHELAEEYLAKTQITPATTKVAQSGSGILDLHHFEPNMGVG